MTTNVNPNTKKQWLHNHTPLLSPLFEVKRLQNKQTTRPSGVYVEIGINMLVLAEVIVEEGGVLPV